MNSLDVDTITFGKYKNKTLKEMLKDRKYCSWFLKETDFQSKYEYIYNKVKEYDPKIYFFPLEELLVGDNFIDNYIYFNLTPVDKVVLPLTEAEKTCYEFYLSMIEELKQKILERIEKRIDNPYDIKAPIKWLQRFEKTTGIPRDMFKEFINAYELANLPYIIEDIKKQGGIVYNGANSFTIAKERSLEQEKFWEGLLKEKYGEDIGVQYKYENCIFDFINISANTLYECKLNMKDFSTDQYNKYLLILGKYKIMYLIDKDCIINIKKQTIYTTDDVKYMMYQSKIPLIETPTKLDEMIVDFRIKKLRDLKHIQKYI